MPDRRGLIDFALSAGNEYASGKVSLIASRFVRESA
jgi:hypothetical protein